MGNLALYTTSVFIWGTTWLAIVFQLGVVPAVLSVAYRFGIAAIFLYLYCLVRRQSLRFNLRQHIRFALQGIGGFGLNYVGLYMASHYLPSGLVSVIFSLLVMFNTILAALFLQRKISKKHIRGIVVGLSGMIMLFYPDIAHAKLGLSLLIGIMWGLGATMLSSCAQTLIAHSLNQGVSTLANMTFSTAYGALASLLFAFLTGHSIVLDLSPTYLFSFAYLVLFGTVLSFASYLKLIQKIGSEKAAYATTLFPVVALFLSTIFEGYQWSLLSAGGLALILLGNVLVLSPSGFFRVVWQRLSQKQVR